jgi:hypothetical protein
MNTFINTVGVIKKLGAKHQKLFTTQWGYLVLDEL